MAIRRRALKQEITKNIEDLPLAQFLATLREYPAHSLVHPLLACLCSNNEKVKWYAVSAFGQVMAQLADEDMEKARVVMRSCMWMLNDESGGIGWGIPEAFAEALSQHAGLAREYTHILVSFMREDGFYIELELLQRGLLWGIGRLAQECPELLIARDAPSYLLPYLDSTDLTVRGLAARVAGLLHVREAVNKLQEMGRETSELRLYDHGVLETVRIKELSDHALSAIQRQ